MGIPAVLLRHILLCREPLNGVDEGAERCAPDLKQLLFILTVSAAEAGPAHFKAAHENVTDDRTHQQTWSLLCQISGQRDSLYVADSKLATTENRAYIHSCGGRFVSVLPRARKEDKTFRERTRSSGGLQWRPIHEKRAIKDRPHK